MDDVCRRTGRWKDCKHYSRCSAAALQYFLQISVKHIQDKDIPYSLCVIEDVSGIGWTATGFISSYVAKLIHKWDTDKEILDKTTFVGLLKNPFPHGLFGCIFEDWLQTALGKERKVLRFLYQGTYQEIQFWRVANSLVLGRLFALVWSRTRKTW